MDVASHAPNALEITAKFPGKGEMRAGPEIAPSRDQLALNEVQDRISGEV